MNKAIITGPGGVPTVGFIIDGPGEYLQRDGKRVTLVKYSPGPKYIYRSSNSGYEYPEDGGWGDANQHPCDIVAKAPPANMADEVAKRVYDNPYSGVWMGAAAAVSRPCSCDLYTVIMRTGCQCGGR